MKSLSRRDEVRSFAALKPYLLSRELMIELGRFGVEFPSETFLITSFFFGMSFFFCIFKFLIIRSCLSSLNERLKDR